MNNFIPLDIYKSQNTFIGKIFLDNKLISDSKSFNSLCTIVIIDVSYSMGTSVYKIIKEILYNLFKKLNYLEKYEIYFILFSDKIQFIKTNYNDMLNIKINFSGTSNLNLALNELENIFINKGYFKYRIITFSDGDLNDQEISEVKCKEILHLIESKKLQINSKVINLMNFYNDDYKKIALNSLSDLTNVNNNNNNNNNNTLLNIYITNDTKTIVNNIYSLFVNDGLDTRILLKNKKNTKCLLIDPWNLNNLSEIPLFLGENIFWLNKDYGNFIYNELNINNNNKKIDENDLFIIEFSDNKNINISIKNKFEEFNFENYKKIIDKKMQFYYSKIKTLKKLNSIKSIEEINNIITYFENFEYNLLNIEEENINYIDNKINTRIFYLEKELQKKEQIYFHKLKYLKIKEQIKILNDSHSDSYFRNIKYNERSSKRLCKKINGLNDNELDEISRKEVINISNHFEEIKDLEKENNNFISSFYSTCTTFDGLKALANIPNKNNLLEKMTTLDIIKLLNIVGIAVNSDYSNFPYPAMYRINKIYSGVYISISDIIVGNEMSKGNNIYYYKKEQEIKNCIPFFENQRIHKFLIKYAPTLLELTASYGMRKMLCYIKNTWKFTFISGIYCAILNLFDEKSEFNMKILINFFHSIQNFPLSFYQKNNINNQLKNVNNIYDLFVFDKSFDYFIMIILFYYKNYKNDNNNFLMKICRSIYQQKIHIKIKKIIKYSEIKTNDFILLCLNLKEESNKIKLKPLFQSDENYLNLINNIINNYQINFNENYINKTFDVIFNENELKIFNILPFISQLLINNKNSYENLKNKIEINLIKDKKFLMKILGINYDYKIYHYYLIIQSLILKNNQNRLDIKKEKCFVYDLVDLKEINNLIKKTLFNIFNDLYIKKIKLKQNQEKIILKSQIENLILNSDSYEKFLNIIKNGIKIGCREFKLKNSTNLKLQKNIFKILLNKDINVKLREEKIMLLVSGRDKDNNIVFNKGNFLQNFNLDNYKHVLSKKNLNILKNRFLFNKINNNKEKEKKNIFNKNKIIISKNNNNIIENNDKNLININNNNDNINNIVVNNNNEI